MGGGDVSNAELLVEMRYIREDMVEVKSDIKDLKSKPCPMAMCHSHETRITTLETYFKIMVAAFVAVVVPLALVLLESLVG